MDLVAIAQANREVLVAGVLSDALDVLGAKDQILTGWKANLPKGQALGRARTIELIEAKGAKERFDLTLSLIDDMNYNEVLVIAGLEHVAYFGEMMGTFASEKQLGGVVVDGATRDSLKTRDLAVPIFARNYSPVDIKGRGCVKSIDTPILLGGRVACNQGDFIYADPDAVVVIPREIEEEIIPIILDILAEEHRIAASLKQGATARELFTTFESF